MIDLEFHYQNMLTRQRELIDEAARRRLLFSSADGIPRGRRSNTWRAALASRLRRLADRLEYPVAQPQLGVLRAVAHREIDVEQAMRLLYGTNGHHSPCG